MNFFSSVFSAAAGVGGEHEEEREEGEAEQEAAEEQGEEGDAGGGWSFGGLIKTLAEEIEGPRDVQEAEGEEGEPEGGEAAEGEEGEEEEADAGGGWIFGGLIKTLAEEIEEQRKLNSQLEAEAAAGAEEEVGEGEGAGPGGAAWSFGGLIQTFASRSESVLEGYRRDIQDLGSGLRLETASLRAAAARAAAAFPGALEAGASAASDRLESVGQAVDDLGAAAAVLLSHANEALRSVDADGEDGGVDGSSHPSDSASGASWHASLPTKKYTRFEAQVLALRADPATFTEEPEDADGFAKWRDTFRIDERKEEIEGVLRESPGLESFVERLVPSVVDYDMFWCRYFFAVDKLRQAEDVRTKLVNRAMSKDDEEELSWEVDDDEDDDNGDSKEGTNKKEEQTEEPVSNKTQDETRGVDAVDVPEDKETTTAAGKDDNGEPKDEAVTPISSNDMKREEKIDTGDSSKESEFSVVSRPSAQEEDLSWEEIEDVGDEDEKKGAGPRSSSPSKVEDVRKQFSSVEDEEELSWDVDDE
ncbi:hypothetical protein E2562_001575 [Oryza meyeriana var. granulata]|uniref:BSD domain-containing protein n=1 Tax=Oryza meyeriana var. granulata TaxID=110450 RepID=A0A6G1CCW3_9ORYZ|nr:hypothetical protein E2562_001575 [Oryza meyeriana var. granulata]